MSERQVALVTGAATGLGRAVCEQLAHQGWTAVLTALTPEEAEAAVHDLVAAGAPPEGLVAYGPLDVRKADDVAGAVQFVTRTFGRLDALVNNAAILLDWSHPSALEVPPDLVMQTFTNNSLGALRMCQAFAPLLVASQGNLVQVSSGMGALEGMGGQFLGYRTSKAALNVLTRVLHSELHGRGVRVNSVCPGHLNNAFGGGRGTRPLAEGAKGVVWAATLGREGPSGGFFRDEEPIPW